MWLHLTIVVFLLLPTYVIAQFYYLCTIGKKATVRVNSPDALRAALSSAKPGHVVLVTKGNYPGNYEPVPRWHVEQAHYREGRQECDLCRCDFHTSRQSWAAGPWQLAKPVW